MNNLHFDLPRYTLVSGKNCFRSIAVKRRLLYATDEEEIFDVLRDAIRASKVPHREFGMSASEAFREAGISMRILDTQNEDVILEFDFDARKMLNANDGRRYFDIMLLDWSGGDESAKALETELGNTQIPDYAYNAYAFRMELVKRGINLNAYDDCAGDSVLEIRIDMKALFGDSLVEDSMPRKIESPAEYKLWLHNDPDAKALFDTLWNSGRRYAALEMLRPYYEQANIKQ